jgi:hypothetical protein
MPPRNHTLLQILNRTPWPHLYFPALYLFLLSASTCALAMHIMFAHTLPGVLAYMCNFFVFLFISVLFHGSIALGMAWWVFRDARFADPKDGAGDADLLVEYVARRIVGAGPWRYAYGPGVAMVGASFAVGAGAVGVHWGDPRATDWRTMVLLRGLLVLGGALNVGGVVLCAGWYVFKDINVRCADGTRQERRDEVGMAEIKSSCALET